MDRVGVNKLARRSLDHDGCRVEVASGGSMRRYSLSFRLVCVSVRSFQHPYTQINAFAVSVPTSRIRSQPAVATALSSDKRQHTHTQGIV